MNNYFKYIPQSQYLINGVPADKAGEWPGQKPNHWRGSIRIIDFNKNNNIFNNTINNKVEKQYKIIKEESKNEEIIKKPIRFRSAKNNINLYKCYGEGLKKFIIQQHKEERNIYGKKHFIEKEKSQEKTERSCIRHVKNSFGNESNFEKEIFVEKLMGKKKRINGRAQQRNYIPEKSYGDKSYREVEQLISYFKEGGYIPGSTNTINYNKSHSLSTYNFYETINLEKSYLNKDLIWKNKLKNEELKADKYYVEELLPKWEMNFLNDDKFNSKDKKNKNAQKGINSFNKTKSLKKL